MDENRNHYLVPIAILTAMLLFAATPWTLRQCRAIYDDATDPIQIAVSRLRQPEFYEPAAMELVRYCRSRPLRALAGAEGLFRTGIPNQPGKGDTLGPAWFPEPILSNILPPLRSAWSDSRQPAPWGHLRFTETGCRMELPGNIGYEVVSPNPPKTPSTRCKVYLVHQGKSDFIAQVDDTHGTALTRPEALERVRQGLQTINETWGLRRALEMNEDSLTLFLGTREEARAACRRLLAAAPDNGSVVVLNALLRAEELSPTDGAALVQEWHDRNPSPERNAVLANFYYLLGDSEHVVNSMRDFGTNSWNKSASHEFFIRSTALALGMYVWREGHPVTGRDAVLFSFEARPGTMYPPWWISIQSALGRAGAIQTPEDLIRLVRNYTDDEVVLNPVSMSCYGVDDPRAQAFADFLDHICTVRPSLLTVPSPMMY